MNSIAFPEQLPHLYSRDAMDRLYPIVDVEPIEEFVTGGEDYQADRSVNHVEISEPFGSSSDEPRMLYVL